jgi:hypothetical protein
MRIQEAAQCFQDRVLGILDPSLAHQHLKLLVQRIGTLHRDRLHARNDSHPVRCAQARPPESSADTRPALRNPAECPSVSLRQDPVRLDQVRLWGATPITQPSGADQGAVTLGNVDGEIGGLTVSDPPTQAEVEALRDKAEELADDVRALATLVNALRGALVTVGVVKGGGSQPAPDRSARRSAH